MVEILKSIFFCFAPAEPLPVHSLTRRKSQVMRFFLSVFKQDLTNRVFLFRFMRESLPPCLSTEESSRTIATSGAFWESNSKSVQGTENVVDLDTKLKLVRKRCIRLIYERKTKTNRLYFNVENTRIYHEVDLKSIELDSVDAKNIKFLIRKYPKFCTANDLKFGDEQSKLELVMGLYEKGILISEKKIETI